VRQHLAGEVLADVGSERNVLGVTKGRVGFGFALRVGDDGGFVVVLAYGRPDCFERAALPVWSPQTCEVTPWCRPTRPRKAKIVCCGYAQARHSVAQPFAAIAYLDYHDVTKVNSDVSPAVTARAGGTPIRRDRAQRSQGPGHRNRMRHD
jgi:hypothetical protein